MVISISPKMEHEIVERLLLMLSFRLPCFTIACEHLIYHGLKHFSSDIPRSDTMFSEGVAYSRHDLSGQLVDASLDLVMVEPGEYMRWYSVRSQDRRM